MMQPDIIRHFACRKSFYIFFTLCLLSVALLPATKSLALNKISPLLEWTTWAQPQDPVLIARRTTSPPTIDGTLHEDEWTKAVWSDAFMDMVDGSKPWLRTEVALLYDDAMLYVAVRMEEPWLESSITERDGPVYRDPDFEIFVAGKDNYWELGINPSGTIYDVFWIWDDALSKERGHDPKRWDQAKRQVLPLSGIGDHKHPRGQRQGFIDENMPGLRSAVSLQGTLNTNGDKDKGWSVELAIPWNVLSMVADGKSVPPGEGQIWRMNLSRFVNRNAEGEAFPMLRPAGWTLVRHGVFDSHVPQRFAPVLFTEMLPDAAVLRSYLDKNTAEEIRAQLGEKVEDFMTEHADFVARAVREAPWRNKLTSDLVKNYLLPYTVKSEPIEPWAAVLRKELLTGIQQLPQPDDMQAAALYIQKWVAQHAVPGLSRPWSMGPLTLMKAGAGRCEELGILYISAAKAVGLPARIAYTPRWRSADGNHLWVEFWNGEKWDSLSVEQVDAAPNTGWFYPLLQKGAVVISRGFGVAPTSWGPNESLAYAGQNSFTVNRTSAYLSTGTAQVVVQDAEGKEVPAMVKAHIFNSGQPHSVLSVYGSDVEFTLGTGSYLFTVSPLGNRNTVQDKALQKEVKIYSPYMFVLQVEKDKKIQHTVNINKPYQMPLQVVEKEGYAPPLAPAPQGPAGVAQKPLPADVDGLSFTDSLYAHVPTLQAEHQAASDAWNALHGDATVKNQELFEPYVRNGRVSLEPFSHWRLPLRTLLEQPEASGHLGPTIVALQNKLETYFAHNKKSIAGLLNIQSILQARPKLTQTQKVLLSVAALRTSGIAARLAPEGASIYTAHMIWAEYFDGTRWRPFLWKDNDKQLNSAIQAYYAQWQTFLLQEMGVQSSDYDQKWNVFSVTSQGNFVKASVSFDDKGTTLHVPQGDYFIVQSNRDNDGWTTWTVAPL